jgi:hypothetical protein
MEEALIRAIIVALFASTLISTGSGMAEAQQHLRVHRVTHFQSCKYLQEPALKPILSNQNLCILVGTQTSNLNGSVMVYLVSPSTIAERNNWINAAGKWLQTQGLHPCAEYTSYLVDPYSPLKPPLLDQVAGQAGEKTYYRLGGIVRPSFCPHPRP